MASIKDVIRHSWLGKYGMMEGKENAGYTGTPSNPRLKRSRSARDTRQSESLPHLRRNTSVTQSVRDVVGTVRQKLKKSTRQRKRLQDGGSPVTPGFKKSKAAGKKTPTRRGGYREVRMYSPFGIDTPDRRESKMGRPLRMKWSDVETPTKLRKEVEDLTANMQALVALTPPTLQTRAQSRRSIALSPSNSNNKKSSKGSRKITVV